MREFHEAGKRFGPGMHERCPKPACMVLWRVLSCKTVETIFLEWRKGEHISPYELDVVQEALEELQQKAAAHTAKRQAPKQPSEWALKNLKGSTP